MFDGVFEPSEEILAAAGREVRRLKRLADDLSSLSAVEEAPRALELLAVDLAGLAADTAERLRPQFQAQDVSLNVETPQPVMVTGDRDRLSQVLMNVLDVHKGSEKRELDAYIAAYAKGGEKVGEFSSQTKALSKAFELCPEG